MNETAQLVASDQTFYLLLVGAIVPLGGYLFNKLAPWDNESIKGIVQLCLSAIAGYFYTYFATDAEGFINLSQGAFSSIVSALFAHNILWKPANINVRLGAVPTPAQTPEPGFNARNT